MPPATAIHRRRHPLREMLAGRGLGSAVRFPVIMFMVGFREKGAGQGGVGIAVAHRRTKGKCAANAQGCGFSLNARYGQTVVSLGPWAPPAGGNVGSKISYTRIPEAEDNW